MDKYIATAICFSPSSLSTYFCQVTPLCLALTIVICHSEVFIGPYTF